MHQSLSTYICVEQNNIKSSVYLCEHNKGTLRLSSQPHGIENVTKLETEPYTLMHDAVISATATGNSHVCV